MSTGKIELFSVLSGFGFVQPSEGTNDVFLACRHCRRAGINWPDEDRAIRSEAAIDREMRATANWKHIWCAIEHSWPAQQSVIGLAPRRFA